MKRNRYDRHPVTINVTNLSDHGSIGSDSGTVDARNISDVRDLNISGSRYQTQEPSHLGGVLAWLGLISAFMAALAAVLNLTTAFKPYNALWSHFRSPQVSTAGLNHTLAPQASLTPGATSTGAEVNPLSPATAAEQAITHYFALAQQDSIDQAWEATTPHFKSRQTKEAFAAWWGPGVVDMDGPYVSLGSLKPISDISGGIWVQLGVRFEEDHIGAMPNTRGWVPKYDVFWYRMVPGDGRYLLDIGKSPGSCPLDLSGLAQCMSSLPLTPELLGTYPPTTSVG